MVGVVLEAGQAGDELGVARRAGGAGLVFEQEGAERHGAEAFGGRAIGGDGGDEAVLRVEDGVFDGLFRVGDGFAVVGLEGEGGCGLGFPFWDDLDGDLQGVEDEAGLLLVERVGGEALENLVEGDLQGGLVFDVGQGEGFAGAALFEVLDRWAVHVVVVAEVFAAERGAAAAVAFGEDVAALVAGWVGGGHGWGSLAKTKAELGFLGSCWDKGGGTWVGGRYGLVNGDGFFFLVVDGWGGGSVG